LNGTKKRKEKKKITSFFFHFHTFHIMEPNARRLAAYLLMHRLREFMGRDFFPFFFSFLSFFFQNRNLISSFSGFTIDATKLEAAMSTCEILGLDQQKVTLQKRLDDKLSKKKLVREILFLLFSPRSSSSSSSFSFSFFEA